MSSAAPTFSQIKAQVASIRRKVPGAKVVGIRATGHWAGERLRMDGTEAYCITQCDSPLQMRLALQEQVPESTTKVLITSLSDQELGDDVLVRLAKRRLIPIDSWQIIKSLFQARSVDPRVSQHPWMAEKLLELAASDDYPPVPGGFLDAETVWPILLSRQLGLTAERPDLQAILKWSIDPDNVSRLRAASDAFRAAVQEWLVQLAGPAAAAVLSCVMASERPDALPVGLASGVVYAKQAAGKLERSLGRIEERFLGGKAPDELLIARWHAAATEVVRLQLTDPRMKRIQLQRADEILRDVQAEAFAYLSDTSPLGFDQRLARYGVMLSDQLQSGAAPSFVPLSEHYESVVRHDAARGEPRRLQRLEMANRLMRWLAQPIESRDKESRSFTEAAQKHLAEGGFVDWARYTLRSGDPVRELSEAYARLWDRVSAIREGQSRRFAELLRDWTAAGSSGKDLIPVERFLDEIIVPLAGTTPVLLVVIDGMSVAVSRELISDVVRQDWVPLCEEGRSFNRPVIATIPSVTEASRTSLLCGQLRTGMASDEASGFAGHAGLLSQSKSAHPPVLFHKVSLQDEEDTSLAASVRKEIGSTQRRVVGVVINAVDDHLLKGQQLDIRWTRDEIKAFSSLLHEARQAGRAVVIVSDHGHILENRTEVGLCEASERWRPAVGQPENNELLVKGSRVLLAESGQLIAPWSERVRYSKGVRNGYHGGLTPQEMVIPLTVLMSTHTAPAGWSESSPDIPDWWEQQPAAFSEPAVTGQVKPIKQKDTGFLFPLDDEEDKTPKAESAAAIQKPDSRWIPSLLASPILEDQKKLAGRAVPPNEAMTRVLATLYQCGGKMTSTALSRALNIPPFRLRGMLAVLQRILNIDGFAVLSRDDASDTVQLDRGLLIKQFDLAE